MTHTPWKTMFFRTKMNSNKTFSTGVHMENNLQFVTVTGQTANETEDTARLIAAAPELLAALELGRHLLTIPAMQGINNPAIADFDRLSAAAISKAKGE